MTFATFHGEKFGSTSFFANLKTKLATGWRRYEEQQRYRALQSLSDRTLRQIGLPREQIASYVKLAG